MAARLSALWAAVFLAAASPAAADGVHLPPTARPWPEAVASLGLGATLVVATVALAGLLLAPLVAGPSPRPERARRLEVWLGGAAAACDVAVLVSRSGPLPGVVSWWPPSVAVVHLALVAVVMAGVTRRPRARVAVWAGLAPTLAGGSHGLWPRSGDLLDWGVGLAHAAVSAAWAGCVLYVAVGVERGPEGPERLAEAIRRVRPAAAVAAGLTVATGAWNMDLHGAWTRVLSATAYGRVLIAKVAVVAVVVAVAGLLLRRRKGLGRLLSGETAGFAVILVLASGLLALPSPAAGRRSGVDLLRPLRLGDVSLTVAVSPQRPGDNLVEIFGSEAPAASVTIGAGTVPLGPLEHGRRSAVVRLEAGRSTLRVMVGDDEAEISLDTAAPSDEGVKVADVVAVGGPDAAECASRHLGRLVALAQATSSSGARYDLVSSVAGPGLPPPPPPSDGAARLGACGHAAGLEPLPADVGSAFVRFLGGRGAQRVMVVTGGSARGRQLAEGAEAAGRRAAVTVDVVDTVVAVPPPGGGPDAVVVADGWEGAADALATFVPRPQRGVYLAPWLLVPDLLRAALDPHEAQISVGTWIAPTSAPAMAYLRALRAFAPGAAPTGAGLTGYLEARLAVPRDHQPGPDLDAVAPSRLELYTPVRLQFLPRDVDHDPGHGDREGFLPGVTLAAVGSVPLKDP